MEDNFKMKEIPDDAVIADAELELPEKVEIVGVRFKKGGKVYFFDPVGVRYNAGDNVIVKTARGLEYGTCADRNRIVSSSEIVLPLRCVLRKATETDEERHEANLQSEQEAMRICNEKIEEHQLEMKLVDVEYTFDNNKLLFYFTADGRVDFRELVKDLAAVFKTRIELRQIGIRDETKLVGGLGVCGRPFCCNTFLTDFSQVSIKMAKEQNLSLNSAKISGACGKLMCCLKFEHETYLDEISRTPKVESIVTTPDGSGVVADANPLTGIVKVKLDSDPDGALHVYHRDILNRPSYPKKKQAKPEPIAEKLSDSKPGESAAAGEASKKNNNYRRNHRNHHKNRRPQQDQPSGSSTKNNNK